MGAELVEDAAEAGGEDEVEHVSPAGEQGEGLLADEGHDRLAFRPRGPSLAEDRARDVHGTAKAVGAPLLLGDVPGIGSVLHPDPSVAPTTAYSSARRRSRWRGIAVIGASAASYSSVT